MKWALLLSLAVTTSCASTTAPTSGSVTAILADSIRFVQVDKLQPYALLWPANETVNLWIAWDEKKQSPLYPYPSCRARFNLALTGKKGLDGTYRGSVTSQWTDSCTVDSASFELTPSGDTLMVGWCLMDWTGPCGASRATLPLALAHTP